MFNRPVCRCQIWELPVQLGAELASSLGLLVPALPTFACLAFAALVLLGQRGLDTNAVA